ncbi:hypothetical protein [uncultured Streptococcus sp.]|nr:hypothetical protein [uncultured Streptococcus sp.]
MSFEGIGKAAGIAFSWAMNKGWFGKKSVNNYAKDGLKGLAGKFGL